jgi:hypothetical protein
MRLTGEPALGYHFGLHLKLSAHGFLGYAVMTSATLGEAIQLVERYFTTRSGPLHFHSFIEGETAVIQIDSTVDVAPPVAFPFESLLVGLCHAGAYITGEAAIDAEVWINYPEPGYYARCAELLPCVIRYDRPVNQLRFPAVLLKQPLAAGGCNRLGDGAGAVRARAGPRCPASHLVTRVRALAG